jgi:hypothetical protein
MSGDRNDAIAVQILRELFCRARSGRRAYRAQCETDIKGRLRGTTATLKTEKNKWYDK